MDKVTKAIAVLKVNIDQHKDYLDTFVPLIQAVLPQFGSEQVTAELAAKAVLEEFGIRLPHHALVSILTRCVKRRILRSAYGMWFADSPSSSSVPMEGRYRDKLRAIGGLVACLSRFADGVGFAEDLGDPEEALLSYFAAYDSEMIMARQDDSVFPAVKRSRKKLFVVNSWARHVYETDRPLYETLVEYAVSYLYASSLFFYTPQDYVGWLDRVTFFLDTRIILRALGLEGEYRKASNREFIAMLHEKRASLAVFDHTLDEIDGILSDCEHWCENPHYDPKFASPAIRYFVENRVSRSDVALFRASVDSALKEMRISVQKDPYSIGLVEDLIDEDRLFRTITDHYRKRNGVADEPPKQETVWRDVKSISAVARLRRGVKGRSLRDAKAVFVTTNGALAEAARVFFGGTRESAIPECVTDGFIGTTVWLESPVKVEELQRLRIVADAAAALEPGPELMERYVHELTKLRNAGTLSEDAYFYMRSHEIPLRLLEQKTAGDPAEFYDRLPHEIYEAVVSNITAQAAAEVEATRSAYEKELRERDMKLDAEKVETKRLSEIVSSTDRWLAGWARLSSVLLGVALSALMAVMVLFSLGLIRVESAVTRYALTAGSFATSFLSLSFGVTVTRVLQRYEAAVVAKLRARVMSPRRTDTSASFDSGEPTP